ncbi:MAG: hypothetical protein LBP64_04545 [Tannerella sp.]|nr:hypothetical protein [Tannerella sp.]
MALILTTVSFKGNAQMEGKKYFITGSAYISSNRSATTSGSTITSNPSELKIGFMPSAGFMLNDKWALLAEIGYSSTIKDNQKTGSDNQVTATPEFRIAAGVRRYLMFNERAGLFFDGKLGGIFGSQQTQQGNTTTSYSASGLYAMIAPGVACFITDRLMLTGQIGGLQFYSKTNNPSADTKTTTNYFDLAFQPSATGNIGLTFFF